MDQTVAALFSEPFGQGYPKSEAARKLDDTRLLKQIRQDSQVKMTDLLKSLDAALIEKIMNKKNVIDFIVKNGRDEEITAFLTSRM